MSLSLACYMGAKSLHVLTIDGSSNVRTYLGVFMTDLFKKGELKCIPS